MATDSNEGIVNCPPYLGSFFSCSSSREILMVMKTPGSILFIGHFRSACVKEAVFPLRELMFYDLLIKVMVCHTNQSGKVGSEGKML